jgi:hypothetical protein
MRWPRADLLSLGILIATVASVVVAVEVSGGDGGSKVTGGTISSTSVSTTDTTGTVVKRGRWDGTVGPLTLTVTQVEREGTTVNLVMTAASESKVTIPFFDNLQATDANGRLYKSPDQYEVLTVIPNTPSKKTTITLEGVTEVPLFLTLSFATVYPSEPRLGEVFHNGIRISEIPIPQ